MQNNIEQVSRGQLSLLMYRYRYFILFGIFLVIYFLLAYHLVFDLHYAFGDAVTRTEKPFLVLYDNEPKLASIGFIWPPLPSLVQIPFIAMFKGIAVYGFAGKLVTVFFGALNVVLIYFFLERMPIRQWQKLILVLCYGLNPMILFYAINGMSETTFLFFVIGIAWHFYRWQQDKRFYHLLAMGVALSLAFLTRYETFALIASVGVLVFLTVTFFTKRQEEKKLPLVKQIKNGLDLTTFVLMPAIITVIAWAGVNWLIMGDPLHFFHGEYSVSEQSNSIGGEAMSVSHDILKSIWYSYKRVAILFPAFSLFSLIIIISIRQYSWLRTSMFMLALTIPAFEVLVHFLGKSFGWLRFFIYSIPFSFILLTVIWNKYTKIKLPMFAVVVVMLVLSGYMSGIAMLDSSFGKEEYASARAFVDNKEIANKDITYDMDIEVVNYLKNELQPTDKILLDDFLGYGIVLNHGDPKIFINNSDKEFDSAVGFPEKYADYILIPAPGSTGIARLDIFNRTYPDMYEKGASYLQLVHSFNNTWRLYRVVDKKGNKF